MICPHCGSADVQVPTVDNGVGMEQCGPASCPDCGWAQQMPEDPFENFPRKTKHGDACLDDNGEWHGAALPDGSGWECDECGEIIPADDRRSDADDDPADSAGLLHREDQG